MSPAPSERGASSGCQSHASNQEASSNKRRQLAEPAGAGEEEGEIEKDVSDYWESILHSTKAVGLQDCIK